MVAVKTDFTGRDGFNWWVGEVEDILDPSQLGRVKVRVLGWYTSNKTDKDGNSAHTQELPRELLPWATVLLPTDKPQTKNAGTTTELQVGSNVLGFFLDGEEGQLPCVMGAFRSFKHAERRNSDDPSGSERDTPNQLGRTTIADPEIGNQLATNTPQQKAVNNQFALGGHPFAKVQGQTPGSAEGGEEVARGAVSKGEVDTPANVYTNPIKLSGMPGGIADGTTGPANKGFQLDMKRMLSDIGVQVGGLAKDSDTGNFMSAISGRVVEGKAILNQLSNVTNYVTNAVSGMLAPLKELAARLIQQAIDTILKLISNMVPVVVVTAIGAILEIIFAMFCKPTPQWVSVMKNIMGFITSYLNKVFDNIMDFIGEMESTILNWVENAMSGIQNQICKALNAINGAADKILSAINVAKGIANLANGIKSIFSLDFTKLDFQSLLSILKAILAMILGNKGCERESRKPKSQAWVPLLGTTQCDPEDTPGVAGPGGGDYSNCPPPSGTNAPGLTSASGGTASTGTFFDDFYKNINPFLMEVQTSLNGTRILNDATPGKEKFVTSGPGGVTYFQDKRGNEHLNVPSNWTAIYGGDLVQDSKGNHVHTVEGDYYLKVMGDMHIEVSGSMNTHVSNGPGAQASDANGGFASGSSWGDQKPLQAAGNSSKFTAADYKDLDPEDGFEALEQSGSTASTATQQMQAVLQDKIARRNKPQFDVEVGERESKSVHTVAGDHDCNYQGDWTVQANKFNFTAVSAINLKGQQINEEAGTISNTAHGEIINEANWITSFLNCGRFDIIGIFQFMPVITGQYSIVKGSIVDVTMDLPFPGASPPAQVRLSLGQSMPTAMADIVTGSSAGGHMTLVASPTGGIGEVVTAGKGAIINQCTSGIISYGVGVGFSAFGTALGATQIYGLPVMLN